MALVMECSWTWRSTLEIKEMCCERAQVVEVWMGSTACTMGIVDFRGEDFACWFLSIHDIDRIYFARFEIQ